MEVLNRNSHVFKIHKRANIKGRSITRNLSAPQAVHSRENLIGLHSQVWVGSWSKEKCELAIGKSAELGYDLIEGCFSEFFLTLKFC